MYACVPSWHLTRTGDKEPFTSQCLLHPVILPSDFGVLLTITPRLSWEIPFILPYPTPITGPRKACRVHFSVSSSLTRFRADLTLNLLLQPTDQPFLRVLRKTVRAPAVASEKLFPIKFYCRRPSGVCRSADAVLLLSNPRTEIFANFKNEGSIRSQIVFPR